MTWDVSPETPLPVGLFLNETTGVLSGRITREDAGETHLTIVHARNDFGEDTKTIELVAGGDHEGNVRFRDRYEAREKEEGNDTWSRLASTDPVTTQ